LGYFTRKFKHNKRYHLAGAGTQTSGLAFGGNQTAPPILASTEEYNGSHLGQQLIVL
jgi:hypothetical protein